jgi:hypothetical protein
MISENVSTATDYCLAFSVHLLNFPAWLFFTIVFFYGVHVFSFLCCVEWFLFCLSLICVLTFSDIMTRTMFYEMIMMSINNMGWTLIILAHWNNRLNPKVDMSLQWNMSAPLFFFMESMFSVFYVVLSGFCFAYLWSVSCVNSARVSGLFVALICVLCQVSVSLDCSLFDKETHG